MIDPVENDIGREVLYVADQWIAAFESGQPTTAQISERGVIKFFNADWVYVAYERGWSAEHGTALATHRRNLYWRT